MATKTIAIGLACAYCFSPIVFQQGAIELRGKSAKPAREGKVCELKCPHCDSRFSVHLTTKRKSKGARLKATEARRAAERERAREDAVRQNLAIAERLLTQSGCTCAPRMARLDERDAEKRYREYGHAFSSASISYGIPNAPHHDHGCPCRGSDEEARIRGAATGRPGDVDDDVGREGAQS